MWAADIQWGHKISDPNKMKIRNAYFLPELEYWLLDSVDCSKIYPSLIFGNLR